MLIKHLFKKNCWKQVPGRSHLRKWNRRNSCQLKPSPGLHLHHETVSLCNSRELQRKVWDHDTIYKPPHIIANTSVIELYVYSVRAYRHKAACFLDVFCFIWAVRFLLAFCFIRAVWFLRVIWLLRVVCFPRVVWFLGVVCFLMVVWFLKVDRFLRVPRIVHARQNHREATPHHRCRCCTKRVRAEVHQHPCDWRC